MRRSRASRALHVRKHRPPPLVTFTCMLEPAGDRSVVLRPSPDSCWPRFPVKRGVERGQSAGNRRDAALPSSPNLYVCWLYVGVDVEHRSRSGRTRRSHLHRASGRAMHVKHLARTSFRPGLTLRSAHAGAQGPPSWSPPALSHRDKSALFPVKPLPKAREAAARITSDVSEPDGQLRRSTRNPPSRADRQAPGKRCRRPRAGSCGKGASTWQGIAPDYLDLWQPSQQTTMIPRVNEALSTDSETHRNSGTVTQKSRVRVQEQFDPSTCDSCGPRPAVHSVQNVVDNHVKTAVRNVRASRRRGKVGSDTHGEGEHIGGIYAGQSDSVCEGCGQSALNAIHNRLWIEVWKEEENTVDNAVDETVHRESLHVRRVGSSEVDRREIIRLRDRTPSPRRAWAVPRCGDG